MTIQDLAGLMLVPTVTLITLMAYDGWKARRARLAFEAEMKRKYPPDGVVPKLPPNIGIAHAPGPDKESLSKWPEPPPAPLRPVIVLHTIKMPNSLSEAIAMHPQQIISVDGKEWGSLVYVRQAFATEIRDLGYFFIETPAEIQMLLDRLRESGSWEPMP